MEPGSSLIGLSPGSSDKGETASSSVILAAGMSRRSVTLCAGSLSCLDMEDSFSAESDPVFVPFSRSAILRNTLRLEFPMTYSVSEYPDIETSRRGALLRSGGTHCFRRNCWLGDLPAQRAEFVMAVLRVSVIWC